MTSTKQVQITLTIPVNFELSEPTPRPPRKGEWYLDWDEEDVTVSQAKETKGECFCFPILRPVKEKTNPLRLTIPRGAGKASMQTCLASHIDFPQMYINTEGMNQEPKWQNVKLPEGFRLAEPEKRLVKAGEWYKHKSGPKLCVNGTTSKYYILKPTMNIPYGFKLKECFKRKAQEGEYYMYGPILRKVSPFGHTLQKYWILELDPPELPEGWEFVEEAPRIPQTGEHYFSDKTQILERSDFPPATLPRFIVRQTWTPPASCPKGSVFRKDFNTWYLFTTADSVGYTAEKFFADFTEPPYSPYTVQ